MNAPADLQNFISILESANELERIKCEVDPYLEVAAIIDDVCKSTQGGKALLFDNVKGSTIPLAANMYGSEKRMAMALGVENIDTLAKKIDGELARLKGVSADQALSNLVQSSRVISAPHPISRGDHGISKRWMNDIPALHSWPGDGGMYLTLAQVFTKMPGAQQQNCGMYRIQVVDEKTALIRCHPGSGGEKHLKAWHELEKPMPIAIALGGPPALTWAAGVSLPNDIEETSFVSWLTGLELPMSQCSHSDLQVPATADILIEGTISPGEYLPEGPFGNHTGNYTEKSAAPVIRVLSVTLKNKPIYPCTVVGPPPMENVFLAHTSSKVLLPFVKHDAPCLDAVYFPIETIYHRIAFVQLSQDCNLSIDEIEYSLSSTLLLKGSKKIIIFDNDVELTDLNEVYWHFINKAGVDKCQQSRLIDARTDSGKKRVQQSAEIKERVRKRWFDYGL